MCKSWLLGGSKLWLTSCALRRALTGVAREADSAQKGVVATERDLAGYRCVSLLLLLPFKTSLDSVVLIVMLLSYRSHNACLLNTCNPL